MCQDSHTTAGTCQGHKQPLPVPEPTPSCGSVMYQGAFQQHSATTAAAVPGAHPYRRPPPPRTTRLWQEQERQALAVCTRGSTAGLLPCHTLPAGQHPSSSSSSSSPDCRWGSGHAAAGAGLTALLLNEWRLHWLCGLHLAASSSSSGGGGSTGLAWCVAWRQE